nr:isoform 2 of arogenate dehydratase/prephenate dehydratase 1, chloroplastic [Quercus suber]
MRRRAIGSVILVAFAVGVEVDGLGVAADSKACFSFFISSSSFFFISSTNLCLQMTYPLVQKMVQKCGLPIRGYREHIVAKFFRFHHRRLASHRCSHHRPRRQRLGLERHLPSEHLSANDLSSCSKDGSKVRVAYQGFPGAYSEAAALKAYPKCETVPRDQFEEAFKVHIVVITYFIAIELWLVDKAILPIENSVGGSIHRNYDLLLRHRLNIVGKVQLQVNHCLLGLSGVRKEEIKNVLSHPQATLIMAIALGYVSIRDAISLSKRAAQIVTIGTWNVAGRLPCEDLEIDDWLCTEEPADIYILGCSKTLYWTKNEFSQLKRKFETVVQILLEARTIYPNLSKLGLALEKS